MTLPQFSGEDLVPKPADKVEEAEPWDGRQQRHAPLSPGVGHVPLLRRPSFPLPIGAAGKTYCWGLLIICSLLDKSFTAIILGYCDNRILWQITCYESEQWTNEQVWPFFGCCTAGSQTDAGRHQLYNNDSLVFFPLLGFNMQLLIKKCCKMSRYFDKLLIVTLLPFRNSVTISEYHCIHLPNWRNPLPQSPSDLAGYYAAAAAAAGHHPFPFPFSIHGKLHTVWGGNLFRRFGKMFS